MLFRSLGSDKIRSKNLDNGNSTYLLFFVKRIDDKYLPGGFSPEIPNGVQDSLIQANNSFLDSLYISACPSTRKNNFLEIAFWTNKLDS